MRIREKQTISVWRRRLGCFTVHLTSLLIPLCDVTRVCGRLHLDVKHDPLVLFHMDAPDAVLPLVVGLGPIRRQHHTSRVCDFPAAHSCNTPTPQPHTSKHRRRLWIALSWKKWMKTKLCVRSKSRWPRSLSFTVHYHKTGLNLLLTSWQEAYKNAYQCWTAWWPQPTGQKIHFPAWLKSFSISVCARMAGQQRPGGQCVTWVCRKQKKKKKRIRIKTWG